MAIKLEIFFSDPFVFGPDCQAPNKEAAKERLRATIPNMIKKMEKNEMQVCECMQGFFIDTVQKKYPMGHVEEEGHKGFLFLVEEKDNVVRLVGLAIKGID